MSNFGSSINMDFRKTGRFYSVKLPDGKRTIGEAVKFLSWGGVVILCNGEEKPRTFSIGEVVEILWKEYERIKHANVDD